MILKAVIEDEIYTLNVPEIILQQAGDVFHKMDQDMEQGWQMSREWVQRPTAIQRCQIVADKLLTALEKDNHKLGMLMAGYILTKLPNLDTVEIDIHGEIQNTAFTFLEPAPDTPVGSPVQVDAGTEESDDTEAREQAERDVSRVFKVGKSYRFSVFDHASGEWCDSPAFASEAEAKRQRLKAFQMRYSALQHPAP